MKHATIMVCSRCAGVIARTTPGVLFDLHSSSWTCPHCSEIWHTCDGWEEVTNLLIPWRASDHNMKVTSADRCPVE